MSKRQCSILFLGKEDDEHVVQALRLCQLHFTAVTAHLGKWGDPLPEDVQTWEGDYILSYLSRWVVPSGLLRNARTAAINFHPASPDYPGIGCNNFALYADAKEYGVTCHHMKAEVDTGDIIAVRRFPVLANDTVATLLFRTYAHQFALFCEVVNFLIEGKQFPLSEAQWTRKPFTRREFNSLRRITPDMPVQEIRRRVRATLFGEWKPTVEIQGYVFELKGGGESQV